MRLPWPGARSIQVETSSSVSIGSLLNGPRLRAAGAVQRFVYAGEPRVLQALPRQPEFAEAYDQRPNHLSGSIRSRLPSM
jgi:hypothetical protein